MLSPSPSLLTMPLPPSSFTAAYPPATTGPLYDGYSLQLSPHCIPVQFTRDDDRANGVDVDSQLEGGTNILTRWFKFIAEVLYDVLLIHAIGTNHVGYEGAKQEGEWDDIRAAFDSRVIANSAFAALILCCAYHLAESGPAYSTMDWRPWIPHHAALITCILAFMVLCANNILFHTPGSILVTFGRKFLVMPIWVALLSIATWVCGMLALLAAAWAGDGSLLLKMSVTAVVAYMVLSHIQYSTSAYRELRASQTVVAMPPAHATIGAMLGTVQEGEPLSERELVPESPLAAENSSMSHVPYLL